MPSIAHRVPKMFAEEIIRRKKIKTAENMCLSLFAMASLDFYDKEYFETVMLSFIDSKQVPHIDQLCFLTQASAILRRSEYTKTLIAWFSQCLFDFQFNLFDPSQR